MQSKSINQWIPKSVEITVPIRSIPEITHDTAYGFDLQARVWYDIEYILCNKEITHRVGYFSVKKLSEWEDTWELSTILTINGHINKNQQWIKWLGEVILKEAFEYIKMHWWKRIVIISIQKAIAFYEKMLERLKNEWLIKDYRVYNWYLFKIEL